MTLDYSDGYICPECGAVLGYDFECGWDYWHRWVICPACGSSWTPEDPEWSVIVDGETEDDHDP
jgi:hypothetical protein